MPVDNPQAYSGKKHQHELDENGYFVTITHGNLFSSKPTPHSYDEKSSLIKLYQEDGLQSDGFRFVQPVALRSFCKFFFPRYRAPNCDTAANNFNYNLWYFQLNYAMLLALVVLVAMQW